MDVVPLNGVALKRRLKMHNGLRVCFQYTSTLQGVEKSMFGFLSQWQRLRRTLAHTYLITRLFERV